MEKGGVVYILTNQSNSTLYVGATSDLYPRIVEHREKKYPRSFTARYNISKLVYYGAHPTITEAIDREKQLKGGSRKKKVDLINSANPELKDLFDDISKW